MCKLSIVRVGVENEQRGSPAQRTFPIILNAQLTIFVSVLRATAERTALPEQMRGRADVTRCGVQVGSEVTTPEVDLRRWHRISREKQPAIYRTV